MNRPQTTLFMLTSLDGKISPGDSSVLDFDKDFPKIKGVKEGLHQYYELESKTDIYSLNSGFVQAKIGVNNKTGPIKKLPVTFIIIDNKPHLKLSGVEYFLKRGKKLFLVTTNKHHPVFKLKNNPNVEIFYYKNRVDFKDLFATFKKQFGVNRITIQTGGTLNSVLLRSGLIDQVSVVVAPVLVGGKDTPTLIGGESLHSIKDLTKIKPLKLIKCVVLKNSYLHLLYKVFNLRA